MPAYTLSASERLTYLRYAGLALPRHTSYPVVPAWRTDYGPAEFAADVRRSAAARRPSALYVHIPFCEKLCYYCACTKEIVPAVKRREHDPADDLLMGLEVEAGRLAELLGTPEVHQMHLGGGSPTFLRVEQIEQLGSILNRHFPPASGAEMAVEIDPRRASREQLLALRGIGFNRVSLGIQDFSEPVQRAVNRVQPFEQVQEVVGWCRELGFNSINFDLIYGLPFQTVATMADTLDKTLALAPDRIAFYRLAVIPEMFRWQKTFVAADLPPGELALELNLLAMNVFTEAGYRFIGLDHFARPDEALSRAHAAGTLQRNFQGMTTGRDLDLIGLGPSAISQLADAYAQNDRTTGDWRRRVETGLATVRGLRLSADDGLRRELLQQLYSYGVIDRRGLERRFDMAFADYFLSELERLDKLEDEGVVSIGPSGIRLTEPLGRLLVRVVAAVFDRYLPPDAYRYGLPVHLASRVG